MRASHDQGIDFSVDQRGHVSSGDLICHRILPQSLFHQRYKEGTCLSVHLCLGHDLPDVIRIGFAGDSGPGADHSDPSVFGSLYGCLCAGTDHSDHRDRTLCFNLGHRIGTGCIAGHGDGLYILFEQKADDLPRIADNGVFGFASVGNTGSISKIHDPLVGHLVHDLFDNRQPSNTGVKDSDGQILSVFSVTLCHHISIPAVSSRPPPVSAAGMLQRDFRPVSSKTAPRGYTVNPVNLPCGSAPV